MAGNIFMIHGMWCGPWYWENFQKYFEGKSFRCLTPTLRYHDVNPEDQPDPRLGTTSLLDYAADLEKEIGALDEKPVIMGHSMGGLLAQMLGGRGLARALVLLTSASPAGIMALTPSVVKTFASVQFRWGFWKKPMRIPFKAAAYSILNVLPPGQQEETYARFVYESGRAAFEIGYWMFDARKASAVDKSQITCPMLIVAGREDKITPLSVERRIAKKYEGIATYREFENQGHWLIAEPGWDNVTRHIAGWLKENL